MFVDEERLAIALESGVSEDRARTIAQCEAARHKNPAQGCLTFCGAHRTFVDGVRFAALLVRYVGGDVRNRAECADYLDGVLVTLADKSMRKGAW